MFETALGVTIGGMLSAVVSWSVAVLYHRRATIGLQQQVDDLRDANWVLQHHLKSLKWTLEHSQEEAAIARAALTRS